MESDTFGGDFMVKLTSRWSGPLGPRQPKECKVIPDQSLLTAWVSEVRVSELSTSFLTHGSSVRRFGSHCNRAVAIENQHALPKSGRISRAIHVLCSFLHRFAKPVESY